MVNEQHLTQNQYTQSFNLLLGMRLIDCYHTQDSVLRFLMKDKGEEITLIVDGDWQLVDKDKVICDSNVRLYESDHEYYERLRRCAAELKRNVHLLSKIYFGDGAKKVTLSFDNGWQFHVQQNKFGLTSYQREKTREYVMYSIDEKTGLPRYYKSMP